MDAPVGILVFCAIVLFVPLVITVMTALSVYKMGSPSLSLQPASQSEFNAQFNLARHHHEWAQQNGFEIVGGYVFDVTSRIFVAAWKHRDEPAYFCIYQHPQMVHFDFVSIFSEETALTTGSTPDTHMLPTPPGSFVQAFPGMQPDALYEKHRHAHDYLTRQCGIRVNPPAWAFEEAVIRSIHRQVAYIRSLPFWPLRACYWYYVRRRRLPNHSIEELHKQGRLAIV